MINRSSYVHHIALLVWLLITVITLFHHELWRDEFQAILLARNSGSLMDLYYNTRYEGHGPLWFFFIFIIKQISDSHLAVQLSHLLIAFLSTWLILYRSPFSITEKLLLIFGYYFVFEYAVISRNYSFAILAMMLFADSFNRSGSKQMYIRSAALCMLGMTGVYGLITSLGLAAYSFLKGDKKEKMILVPLMTTLTVFMGIFMQPPEDGGFAADWFFNADGKKLVHAFEIIYEALIPIPSLNLNFWDSNILDGSPALTVVKLVLSVALLILIYNLLTDKKLLFAFLMITFGIVVFTYIKYDSLVRHFGHIFIALVACYWIHRIDLKSSFNRIWLVLIILHVPAGLFSLGMDLAHPFSGAKEASDFLLEETDSTALLSADTDFIGTPISGYMNREIYYPQSNRFGTYMIFDKKRSELVNFDTVYARTLRQAGKGQEVYFILDYPADSGYHDVTEVYRGPLPIVKNENYIIYKLVKP